MVHADAEYLRARFFAVLAPLPRVQEAVRSKCVEVSFPRAFVLDELDRVLVGTLREPLIYRLCDRSRLYWRNIDVGRQGQDCFRDAFSIRALALVVRAMNIFFWRNGSVVPNIADMDPSFFQEPYQTSAILCSN